MASCTADQLREDVDNLYNCGEYHGFSIRFEYNVSTTSNHTVAVYALDTKSSNYNTILTNSPKTVTVTPGDKIPIGSLDGATGRENEISVRGWAYDPDELSKTLDIHIYVDDKKVAECRADQLRSDVGSFYQCGDYHGFSTTFDYNVESSGSHQVKAYAINSNQSGANALLTHSPMNVIVTAHEHSYSSYITKEATTTEEGIITYTCEGCGDSYIETIPKLDINEPNFDTYNITYHLDGGINHASNPMTYTSLNPYVDLKDPTKDGYVFEGWYTAKTGGTQVTNSTKLDGNIDLYARWIPVSSGHVHNWNTDYTVDTEPNCIKEGSKSIHCNGCDETKDIVIIPALGHEWDENISHDEVNHWYDCKRCTEIKEKARHSGNQSTDGKTAVCEICGISYETDLKLPFVDVYKDDWFYDSVFTNYFDGLMTGMDATHFAPYNSLSRAQFAVILHRMNRAPKMEYKSAFPDVPAETWYTDAVLWANDQKIITGYANGYFGAADNITREQMALMMYRYANSKNYDTNWKADFDTFKDATKVSGFAQEALRWAVGNNIITGKENGTMLDPQGNASRAECATIINRFLNAYEL